MSFPEQSFSDRWDKQYTTEIALFDPVVRMFRLEFDREFGRKNHGEITPLQKAIDEYQESKENLPETKVTQDQMSDVILTKLIADLDRTSSRALDDYDQALEFQYTDDVIKSQFLEDKRKDFFSNGIKRYASIIEKLFDRLTKQDNYPKGIFSNYKQIIRLIDVTEGEVSAMHLRELIMIAESVIPPSVKEEHTEVVESNNSYSNSVEEG